VAGAIGPPLRKQLLIRRSCLRLQHRRRKVLHRLDGGSNSSIAGRLKLTNATVGKWRARFLERGIAGLYDDVRPGPARSIDDERVAQLIKTTLHTKPADGSTRWSVRSVAGETGISTRLNASSR
jgi:putative transposase